MTKTKRQKQRRAQQGRRRRGVQGRRAPVTVVRPQVAVGRPRPRRRTGRSNLLGDIAGTAGSLISPAVGRLARRAVGGISRIVGRGDYVISGNVKSNSLAGTSPPQFGDASGTTRIRHREYIQDINGSVGFAIQTFNIQPGLVFLFPWLSRIAAAYEQYRIMGMCVEFKSTSASALNSTNTALGVVGLVTQYDAHEAPFQSKQESENYVGCQTANPSQSILHFVECASGQNPLDKMYIRTGALNEGADIKFYDYGLVNIFTQGMQAIATIGELWVSYDVEFSKPKLPTGITLASGSDFYRAYAVSNGVQAWTSGLVRYPTYGSLGTYQIDQKIYFPREMPPGNYQIVLDVLFTTGSGNVAITSGVVFGTDAGSGFIGGSAQPALIYPTDAVSGTGAQVATASIATPGRCQLLYALHLDKLRGGTFYVDLKFLPMTNTVISYDITVTPMYTLPPNVITMSRGMPELSNKVLDLQNMLYELKNNLSLLLPDSQRPRVLSTESVTEILTKKE